MEEHLGYGEYKVTVDSRVDSFDWRAVFGIFVYQSQDEEIDIEFSQVLANPHNAQYVVQPYNREGNLVRFDIGTEPVTSHRFIWLADRIVFESWRGDAAEPTPETQVYSWTYTGPDIPVPDRERMRFNLWLFNGSAPSSGQGDEVIIRSFEYMPK